MAKKNGKISISEFEKIMNEFSNVVKVKWMGIEIEIKRTLSLMEAIMFSNDIVSNCYNEETGDFTPEVMDAVIRCDILQMYGNFTLPKDTEKAYELSYKTDAVDVILENIDGGQLESIISAATKKIEFMKNTKESAIRNELDMLANDLNQLVSMISGGVSNLSEEEIKNFVSAVEDNVIDYDELLRLYNTRMNAQNKSESDDMNTGDIDGSDN